MTHIIQEILVFITFSFAVGYMFTKFIYKPSFIFGKEKSKASGCDTGCGSCH
ncbi:MAG: hypothetical protein WBL27_08400 [Salinimicrobium sp.]